MQVNLEQPGKALLNFVRNFQPETRRPSKKSISRLAPCQSRRSIFWGSKAVGTRAVHVWNRKRTAPTQTCAAPQSVVVNRPLRALILPSVPRNSTSKKPATAASKTRFRLERFHSGANEPARKKWELQEAELLRSQGSSSGNGPRKSRLPVGDSRAGLRSKAQALRGRRLAHKNARPRRSRSSKPSKNFLPVEGLQFQKQNALGPAAALRFGRGRAKSSPQKFSEFQARIPQNFCEA